MSDWNQPGQGAYWVPTVPNPDPRHDVTGENGCPNLERGSTAAMVAISVFVLAVVGLAVYCIVWA